MSVRVRRANGERVIPDEKVTEYLEMGYSVIDDLGNVVRRPKPKITDEIKAMLAEKDKAIDCLLKEIDTLKAMLAEKEKNVSEMEKSVSEPEKKRKTASAKAE